MKRVGKVIADVIEPLLNKQGFVCGRIVTHWPEIIGSQYSNLALPDKITFPQGKRSEGTLHLTTNAAAALILQHSQELLMERINTYFGYKAVTRLRFKYG